MKNHATKTIMGLKKTPKRFEAWALNKRTSLENVSEEQSTEFHESESSSDEKFLTDNLRGRGSPNDCHIPNFYLPSEYVHEFTRHDFPDQ